MTKYKLCKIMIERILGIIAKGAFMVKYNCLLLDVDGTLLDFAETERAAFEKTLTNFEVPYSEKLLEDYRGINQSLWEKLEKGAIKKEALVVKRWEDLLKEAGAQGDPAAFNAYYLEQLTKCTTAYAGADEMLEELAEVATIAFVTNGVDRIQRARLKASGLDQFADEIFVSERLGSVKPNRKFFDQALKKLGVSNRQKVLVVGDSLQADIKGGQNASLDTCWINFERKENTTDIKPMYAIDSYEELKVIVYGEDGPPDVNQAHRNEH